MKLKQLLTAIKYRAEQVPDVDITDLVYDSRKAVPGCAFVCLRGANADGHKYAKMAAEKGAAVIIAEEPVEAPVPVILTDNTRLALAYLSAEFFGHPAEQMHVITASHGQIGSEQINIPAVIITRVRLYCRIIVNTRFCMQSVTGRSYRELRPENTYRIRLYAVFYRFDLH